MRLQAITICINYADYLECVVANRRHFDRWIILTVPKDAATIAMCERLGLEYQLSKTLLPDGRDFNAAYNKSAVINEGLDLLDQEGWALIVDADVLLPRNFRERVNGMSLDSGCLYGMSGRRICTDRAKFEMMVPLEPWDRFCSRHSGIFGYFNLFDLAKGPNRYIRSGAGYPGQHDDNLFQEQFAIANRRTVPMTVIHVGRAWENWHGRTSRAFTHQARPENLHADLRGMNAQGALMPAAAGGIAALVGYFPGSNDLGKFDGYSRVLLVDQFAVHTPSSALLIEEDRVTLRELMQAELAVRTNWELVGPHTESTLAKIAPHSLDHLHFSDEIVPAWLVPALPLWLEKLKPGGIISGNHYGLPHWPDSTYAVAMLLGTPDRTEGTGAWWKQIDRVPWHERLRFRKTPSLPAEDHCVLLVNRENDDLPKQLVTLSSVRKSWAGPIIIYHWGEPNYGLQIAALKMDAWLVEAGSGYATQFGRYEDLVWEAGEMCPLKEFLFLPPGAVCTTALSFWKEEPLPDAPPEGGTRSAARRDSGSVGDGDFSRPHIGTAAPARRIARFQAARAVEGEWKGRGFIYSREVPETWSDDLWNRWTEAETEFLQMMAVPVMVPTGVTVVTIIDSEMAELSAKRFAGISFSPGVPWIVIAVGPHSPAGQPSQAVTSPVWLPIGVDAATALPAIDRHITTGQVIVIPSTVTPHPGAILDPNWHADDSKDVRAGEFDGFPFFSAIPKEKFLQEFESIARLGTIPLLRAAQKPLNKVQRELSRQMGWNGM